MYTLKSIARRGTSFSAALALVVSSVGAAVLPAMSAYADALNPLTERSLTLSSSSPGWSHTDGSGNSTYAPPNSGANGQKTGNYFAFKPSSTATVNTFSFQYCKQSAGSCDIPGDNNPVPSADTSSTSDLNVNYPSATEIDGTENAGTGTITTNGTTAVVGSGTAFTTDLKVGGTIKTAGGSYYVIASITDNTHLTLTTTAAAEAGVAFSTSDFMQVINPATGVVKAIPGYTNNNPKYSGSGDPAEAAKDVTGNYIVMSKVAGVWTQSTGWTVAAHNVTTGARTTNNYITLTKAAGVALTAGQEVKVLFFATGTNYITNPGSGAFFVKINTYNKEYNASPSGGQVGLAGLQPATDANVIDGGVTVANVMNQSIQITTKVLETMQFSVGTVDPNTLDKTELQASDNGNNTHTPCDTILTRTGTTGTKNVLELGNQSAESSLETDKAYATHSYWRLSSNSSAGATVYYSGHTLSNTVGDEIDPIGVTKKSSAPGSEQFGLALATVALTGGHGFDDATYGVNYTTDGAGVQENAEDTVGGVAPTLDDTVLTDLGAVNTPPWNYTNLNASYHQPRLDPLQPAANYTDGSGTLTSGGTAKFAFDPLSDTVPVPIASESSDVVDCVTAKMRYVANIAATTPAGIYTTKVNYIAAPQY